jgi:hypothetical protein
MSKYNPEYQRAYADAHREHKREYQRAYYQAHRTQMINTAKAQYAADPVAAKARSRAWMVAHPLAQKGYMYKLSAAKVEHMVMMSCGLCEICGVTFDVRRDKPGTSKHAMTIDHDHATGKVRGLICSSCNIMLSRAQDNPRVLEEAARYLAKEAA